jgi:hypothetical protein
MSRNYKAEAVVQLAKEITEAGFRAFIAKRGHYGFYTDAEGTRVVSFQYDLGGFTFSGDYKSKSCGSGWRLEDGTFAEMFSQIPPRWATKGEAVTLTTLAQHLATYDKSSFYVEYPELPAACLTHYGLTEAEMRAKTGSNGSFEGPMPVCGNGSYHVTVTREKAHVNCAACLSKLGE